MFASLVGREDVEEMVVFCQGSLAKHHHLFNII